MAEKLEIYKCELCGNIVEVLHGGEGELVCCGQPMVLLEENTVDAAKEKHVPVIEKTDAGVKVKIGAVAHPMEEKHYIELSWFSVKWNFRPLKKTAVPAFDVEVFLQPSSNTELL